MSQIISGSAQNVTLHNTVTKSAKGSIGSFTGNSANLKGIPHRLNLGVNMNCMLLQKLKVSIHVASV